MRENQRYIIFRRLQSEQTNLLNHVALTIALIVGIIIFISPVASAHIIVTSNGRIFGQLLNGSRNSAAVVGQQVTLQMAQGSNAQDVTTATTDARGFFSFPGLATDKTLSYAVYLRYQGAQYVTDVVTLDQKAVQQVNLTVYDATTSTAKIAIIQATVLMHEPDAQKGLITISEAYSFKNLDKQTFVGSLDASKGRPQALSFSLPQGARNITLDKGFDGYQVIQVDRGFATDAALLPGDTDFAFAYDIPYSASTYDFRYSVMYPTVELSFMVPPDIRASSGSLASAGVIATGQSTYRLFKTSDLLTHDEIHLGVEGLPAPVLASTSSPLDPRMIWLIVGLLLLVAIVVVTLFVYRFRENFGRVATRSRKSAGRSSKKSLSKATKNAAQSEQKKGTAPVEQKKGTTPVAANRKKDVSPGTVEQKKVTSSTATDRRQALLQDLLELDKSFDAGELTREVYQERRAKTKTRLRSLIGDQEAHKK